MCAEVYDKLPVSAEVKDLFRYVNGFVGCFHDLAFVFFYIGSVFALWCAFEIFYKSAQILSTSSWHLIYRISKGSKKESGRNVKNMT